MCHSVVASLDRELASRLGGSLILLRGEIELIAAVGLGLRHGLGHFEVAPRGLLGLLTALEIDEFALGLNGLLREGA